MNNSGGQNSGMMPYYVGPYDGIGVRLEQGMEVAASRILSEFTMVR